MSQLESVLLHLKSGYSITSMQAIEMYGATRLSAIIFDLREKGYHIETIRRKGVSMFGKPYSYAEYRLIED